ncbi:hypothetical protein BCR34DRAFT_42403 [Clohesyomyces aquaticus]|uniref:Uncharacterized protein n=1 Tax=Clohesyomyces aquaticus TaxID=1231657 RepID=A0A1Y1Z7Y5_9PLEO|nr:hypothetical protein BCR34DRAFT_42403 [Clohesyomyces aquaticus]
MLPSPSLPPPPSPNPEISRVRLRELASWIRDELDPVIARDGPEKLLPDDVLTLHEVFLALQHSQRITALDLRATRIHKAVQEVSGKATRWPGRLADDCDRIIAVWEAKFGKLHQLHPFMYGRGGRLEGIASKEEFSKAALVKRWAHQCPWRITPKKSRRHGDLGFPPGSWWLNPIFAHYAGMLDLESTDGGICYDKNGAYALLLKDTGELEAPSLDWLTYRCKRNDAGRFRLTAADANSRQPIRILRNHSLNSVWGPKAGVRYEGLYCVSGWTVRPIRPNDIIGLEYNVGDIVFEIKFERKDPVPLEEVLKHPTSAEIDDYTEYKRLRRVQREGHHNQHIDQKSPARTPDPFGARNTDVMGPNPPTNVPPLALSPIINKRAMSKAAVSPTPSWHSTFSKEAPSIPPGSPRRVKSPGPTADSPLSLGPKATSSSESPANSDTHSPLQKLPSAGTNTQKSLLSDIKAVAPWVEFDDHLAPPAAPSNNNASRRQTFYRDARISPSSTRAVSPHSSTSNPNSQMSKSDLKSSSPTSRGFSRSPTKVPEHVRKSRERQERKSLQILEQDLEKGESRRSLIKPGVRSRNPLAKLFDGGSETLDREYHAQLDYFTYPKREARESERQRRLKLASSSSATMRPLSPIPYRPLSPLSPLLGSRRDAVVFPYGFGVVSLIDSLKNSVSETITATSSFPDDPFTDAPRGEQMVESSFTDAIRASERQLLAHVPRRQSYHGNIPMALKEYISPPSPAPPMSVATAVTTLRPDSLKPRNRTLPRSSPGSLAEHALREAIREEVIGPSSRKVLFKDPFKDSDRSGHKSWKDGSESVEKLAPESVA